MEDVDTKALRWVRVFPTQLYAVDLPPTARVSDNGDGLGLGYHFYGRMNGNGAGDGPIFWDDYGDGWNYGNGKGWGAGSGYGDPNGDSNN